MYPSVEPKFYRELIPGEHWKGETTFRLKTTATGQQLSSTGSTSVGQQASASTRAQAPYTTPRTRANNEKVPYSLKNNKYKHQAGEATPHHQGTKDKSYNNTNGCFE